MIHLNSISIKNWHSFDDKGIFIESFGDINVFIGRNNQGKSNLLSAIKLLDHNELISFLDDIPDTNERFNETTTISSQHAISPIYFACSYIELNNSFPKRMPIEITFNFEHEYNDHEFKIKIESILHKDGKDFSYLDEDNIYRRTTTPITYYLDDNEIELNTNLFDLPEIVHPISIHALSESNYDLDELKDKLMDIREFEKSTFVDILLDTVSSLSPDMKKLHLLHLNPVFPHDAEGKNIFDVQKQIYEQKLYVKNELFDDEYHFTIDSLGSGQKQVLALIGEILLAKEEGASIITIDELELHLYPALLKKVLFFIMDQSDNLQFFITSHSNIVVSTPFNQKVFSVRMNDGATKIEEAISTHDYYDIFEELGVKASDILQSNGVIWVEGPSDAVILRNWLSFLGVDSRSLEFVSFVWYGGRSVKRLDFWELVRLNPNAVLIQDSDLKGSNTILGEDKKEIIQRCSDNNVYCWTTDRREIENYFSEGALNRFFEEHSRLERLTDAEFGPFSDIECFISNYKGRKVDYGKELSSYMQIEDIISNCELNRELSKLKELITKWNLNRIISEEY